ncbi:AraC family transcriptional regulator [Streptomyces capoamus]|uniref:AraC family transcriptional regulator n=1 Tax=Streptomyces capoamus TaxID=68183 RepID=A0A919BZR7_9ACTN|nr:AraC family transcriptional regulator [Streptomyces capoamus]GGW17211.1 AraC family transcriptional regulator [Streptomyces libani subsp. rufus]GHG37383.1 AraC family transcriptional regulator [Streptomyces capoamus]
MDVVSDAIAAVRVGSPSSNRLRVTGAWCVRLAPYEGAGFHVVLGGSCLLLPDGGGEPVALGPGDVVLLPHGAGHVLAHAAAEPADVRRAVPFEELRDTDVRRSGPGPAVELLCGKYRLDRSRTHPLMAELPQVVHLPHRAGGHPELRAAVDLLARELAERRPGGCLVLPSLLDLLLVYLVRAWMAEAETGAWPAVLDDPVTTAALRAVHSDPAAPWTAARLAAEAGVSRATLARRFTALVGRPPMAYLTWWRLTLAATRLRETDAPLTTVARETGYGSPYALSHAFSREFGITPSAYRGSGVKRP